MMNIDLEALHLNPLNYCDLMPRTTTVVLFAARSRVSCTCPIPIHARSSLCTLTAFLPLIDVSHLQSPFLHLRTIYLMGSFSSRISFLGLVHICHFSSLDGLYSLDVSHRLVHSYWCPYMICRHPSHG